MIGRVLRNLDRVPDWLMGRLPQRGAILAYHRVAPVADDPYGIAIAPGRFEEHLALVRRHAHPMRLAEIHAAAREARLPRGAVAITLDDGYRDALTTALPLLERHGVPATVFVVSGRLGEPRGYWWDELQRLFAAREALPEALELRVRGRTHRWRVRDAREPVFWAVYALMVPLEHREQERLLDALRAWAGGLPACPAADRALDREELAALAAHPLVDIGAHSVTHPCLRLLDAAAKAREALVSRRELEGVAGRRIESFAYPHGSYDRGCMRAVEAAGFARACTSNPDRLTPSSHRFSLPRIDVSGSCAQAFEARLGWLLH